MSGGSDTEDLETIFQRCVMSSQIDSKDELFQRMEKFQNVMILNA